MLRKGLRRYLILIFLTATFLAFINLVVDATIIELYTNGQSMSEGIQDKRGKYLKGNGVAGSSCLYQIIDAGPNFVPEMPSEFGSPEGDDVLISLGYIGDDGIINKGSMWQEVDVSPGHKIFVRAWDNFTFEKSDCFGDSELYEVGETPFPSSEKFDINGKRKPAFKTLQTKGNKSLSND